MVVSPGNVVSSAPWAHPSFTASAADIARQQSVEEARRESIAAAYAVQHVQFGHRSHVGFAVDPGDGAPTVPVGGLHLAKGGGDHLDVRMLFHHLVDHLEEGGRIELGFRRCLGSGQAQALLQIFFIAHQHIDILHDASQHFHGALGAAGDIPELLAIVQVEAHYRAGFLGRLRGFDDQFRRGLGKRRENAARVEPAHALAEDGLPIEIAGLEQRAGLVTPVVENHWGAHALARDREYTAAILGPLTPLCLNSL